MASSHPVSDLCPAPRLECCDRPQSLSVSPPRRSAAAGRLLLVVLLALLAGVLRLVSLDSAYDIFGDEVDYTSLGLSVRSGHFPPQVDHVAFFLHPPLVFIVGAGWEDVFSIYGSYFHYVYSMRGMNVAFAVVSSVLLYAVGERLAGRFAGFATALLFSLDAYILRQNGRVLLETCTLTFILGGWLIVLRLYQDRARRPKLIACVGGLLLGLGVVSNDICFPLIALPLLVAVWKDWGFGRRISVLTLGMSLVPYACYVVALAVLGEFGAFLTQTTSGFERFLGLSKQTGFSRAGSPSLIHTMLSQVGKFGLTYLGCGLGVLAAIYLLTIPRQDVRLLALVTFGGAVTLGYAVLFGTIEEQFLYYLYVPALLSMVLGAVFGTRRLLESGASTWWRRAAVACLVVFVLYDFGVWVQIRTTPDNGLQRMVSWFHTHAPEAGTISNNGDASAYMLQRDGFPKEILAGTPRSMAKDHVRYLVVLKSIAVGNYSEEGVGGIPGSGIGARQVSYYANHAREVFSFPEATYGRVTIYETDNPSLW